MGMGRARFSVAERRVGSRQGPRSLCVAAHVLKRLRHDLKVRGVYARGALVGRLDNEFDRTLDILGQHAPDRHPLAKLSRLVLTFITINPYNFVTSDMVKFKND